MITEETAGILLEPLQGEGGIYPIAPDYLEAVRDIADTHNLLVCFDEVQCGYGRTGRLFHHQHYNVEPDILTSAKGIGNGFPLAACMVTQHVGNTITPGTHGSTYGGNPLAMAVGNAVLDILTEEGFMENVTAFGDFFGNALHTLQSEFPTLITEIRGVGCIWGIALSVSAKPLLEQCIAKGLILTRAGEDRVLRIVPPLIVSQNEGEQAIAILREVFSEYKSA